MIVEPYIYTSKNRDGLFEAKLEIKTDSEQVYIDFIQFAVDFMKAHQTQDRPEPAP